MAVPGDPTGGGDDLVTRLVMIQSTGVAQPVGEVASDELRYHAGRTMRVLNSPPNILFLQDVDAPSVKIAGEIQSASHIHDVCAMAAHSRWRGQLVMANELATRYLFINEGYVVGAYSTAPPERLGAVMVRLGVMTEEQVDATIASTGDGVRFGDAAVELGFVDREALYRYLVKQSEMIVYGAVSVQRGTFAFFDDFDDNLLSFPLTLPLTELLMEGVRRMDEMEFFRAMIPSDGHVPERARPEGPAEDHASRSTWDAIDGKRDVSAIALHVGQEVFDVTKTLYELIKKRRITVKEPKPTGGIEGVVDVFNEALRLIMVEVNKYPGASRDIRDSLASFAASGVVYDPIFRGAGPSAEDGTLDVAAVAANVAKLGEREPERALAEWLYEYASFAMFIAEPVLRAGPGSDAAAITAQVSALLAPLAPEL